KPVTYHIEPGIGLWYLVDREHGMGNIPMRVDYMDVANEIEPNRPLRIPIGFSSGRKTVHIDFDRETSAHFIVGGTTGSGKSSALHTIICTLIKQPPEIIKLALFDFKRVEFKPFYSDIPHLMHEIVVEPERFSDKILAVAKLADERYREMEHRKITHIKRMNATLPRGQRWPYIIVIVDELG